MHAVAPTPVFQDIDQGTAPSVPGEADLLPYCLYFMVCAATEGPLKGLFKMGITNSLPNRHREHSRVWGAFDLARSIVLCAHSRREVVNLETSLRQLFGDCAAEDRAMTRGQVLTSEDFIAMGSWRRYPGRRDKGHTEFYTMAGFDPMVARAGEWLVTRGRRAAGARLQRGISPSECLTHTQRATLLLTRPELRELRAENRAAKQRFAEQVRVESGRLMTQVLTFAQAHEEYLLGVDLRFWRRVRTTRDAAQGKNGLVHLYFRTLDHWLYRDDPRLQAWIDAEWGLQQEFAPTSALLDTLEPPNLLRRGFVSRFREGVYTLAGGNSYPDGDHLPYPTPFGTVCVRVGNEYSDHFGPAFERFEELSRRAEGRWAWQQAELCL